MHSHFFLGSTIHSTRGMCWDGKCVRREAGGCVRLAQGSAGQLLPLL